MMLTLALALAMPIIAGVCFLAYLVFMVFVVIKTGGTEGLKDVATAMRAYRVPLLSRSGKRPPTGGRSAS